MVKLLRSCLKLVLHASKNSQCLAETGQIKAVVQSELIKFVTSLVDFTHAEGSFFTTQQLLFLELHLQVEALRERSNSKHKTNLLQFLEDSTAICEIKKFMQIIRERDSFDLLKYLYHLENLEEHQVELMN